MIYVVMGVAGCGKTTIGRMLAGHLGVDFIDADDVHPQANVEKMSRGEPLTDEDRRPWLQILAEKMAELGENGLVVACSALKEDYREILAECGLGIRWIVLEAGHETLADRLRQRAGHFFPADLLASQREVFEPPAGAWFFNAENTPERILERIIEKLDRFECMSTVGVIGLGVMGGNLALNFAENGWNTSIYNREVPGVEEGVASKLAKANPQFENLHVSESIIDFVQSLCRPRVIILMVTAGPAVDAVIDELSVFLNYGDVVIDGGNSYYRDAIRRQAELNPLGVSFIGMGISGGLKGARYGPSMMPGGNPDAYEVVADILQSVAATDPDGNPCCAYIGSGGAGHFVKMVHNGIEYAEMQLLADCYTILRKSLNYTNKQAADLFETWRQNHDSFLLQITVDILRTETDSGEILEMISDVASHKGTGRWTVEEAMKLGVPCDTIAAALFTRQASSRLPLRKAMAESTIGGIESGIKINTENLEGAYALTRLVNHAIGFDMLTAASAEHGWDLHLAAIAKIWTGGCIIRSDLMYDLSEQITPQMKHLFELSHAKAAISTQTGALQTVVAHSATANLPTPVFSAALVYLTNMTTTNLATNLIQAQRDYFGSHGFRLDSDPAGELHHHHWTNGDD